VSRPDINPAVAFVRVPTPDAWLQAVPGHLPELLIDHANCEKKAASTALSLMYRYVEKPQLLQKMSRLAREELRHFEQVMDLMARQQVAYVQLSASRYAGRLHTLVASSEPERLVDTLILGAVVEARSCERFVRLAEVLPGEMADLYRQLVHSEARHFTDYLQLAEAAAEGDISARIEKFLQLDAELVTSADEQFRFHSGVPG